MNIKKFINSIQVGYIINMGKGNIGIHVKEIIMSSTNHKWGKPITIIKLKKEEKKIPSCVPFQSRVDALLVAGG